MLKQDCIKYTWTDMILTMPGVIITQTRVNYLQLAYLVHSIHDTYKSYIHCTNQTDVH